jgi:parvulin-like peptidyl-prolyl isomerase
LAKKKAEKPQRIFTKQQLSRWQQQEKRRRIILWTGISIIVAVLAIIGVGWFLGQYQPFHKPAIRVNDTEFNMKYYIEMLKLNAQNQPASYLPSIADEVINNIEQNELIRQEALKLGFSISDDAVREELKNANMPNNEIYRDLVRNQLLINKLLDEYFDQPVPVSAEQRQVMAMLLESKPQATEVRARLENSENFTELAAELSLEPFTKANKGDLGWHPREVLNDLLDASIVENIFSAEVGILSQPLYDDEIVKGIGYWLVKVLDRNEEEEEASVQIMLIDDEAEAQEIIGRLKAGEDFAALAKEFSLLEGVEENEGEYALTPGMFSPVIEDYVLNPDTELETISEPIRDETITTEGGYWLIKVVAEDMNRQIEKDDRDWLKTKLLNQWLSSLWGNPENKVDNSYLDDAKKTWAIEQVLKG